MKAQIEENLLFWPQHMIHKCKQRFTKMTQYLLRMRRLQLESRTELAPIKQKIERRERAREAKALEASRLEQSIEKELLQRLEHGTYGDIYNYPKQQFEEAMEEQNAVEDEQEFVEDLSEGEIQDIEDFADVEFEEELEHEEEILPNGNGPLSNEVSSESKTVAEKV